MKRMDTVFVARPFYGSMRIAATLCTGGETVNRKRVQRLMRAMGDRGAGAEAAHQQAGAGAQNLSVSAAGSAHRTRQPSVVRRHHLYPDAARVSVFGGGDGLVEDGVRRRRRRASRVVPKARDTRDGRFLAELRERMAAHDLEMHPERTPLIEFGRNAARDRAARGERKPEPSTSWALPT